MRYRYLTTYTVFGLVRNPSINDIEIYRSADNSVSAALTSDINPKLYELDRKLAIGMDMFSKAFMNKPFDIQDSIKSSQSYRTKKTENCIVLLISIEGDTNLLHSEMHKIYDDVSHGNELIDSNALMAKHQNIVDVIVSSVSMSTNSKGYFESLDKGIYLIDNNGRSVYSYTLEVLPGEVRVSDNLTPELAKSITAFVNTAVSVINLDRVARLLTLTSDKRYDRLRSFLTGWAGLELFIKTFYTNESTTSIKPIGAKISLKKQFQFANKTLFGKEQKSDIELFGELYKSRNRFFHEQSISESDLRTSDLRSLLVRYMHAYIRYKSQQTKAI